MRRKDNSFVVNQGNSMLWEDFYTEVLPVDFCCQQ